VVVLGESAIPALVTVTAKDPSQLPLRVKASLIAVLAVGAVTVSTGAVLSTVKVALGPAAAESLLLASMSRWFWSQWETERTDLSPERSHPLRLADQDKGSVEGGAPMRAVESESVAAVAPAPDA
jgi:hypothetical protein